MKLETVKIELGNGEHAVVYKDVLRRTARLHQIELRKYMTPTQKLGKVKMTDLERLETMPSIDYEINLDAIDQAANDAINELFILNQVVEWSLGPVTHDVIENGMTREQYNTLVQEMDRLYKPVPLADSAS